LSPRENRTGDQAIAQAISVSDLQIDSSVKHLGVTLLISVWWKVMLAIVASSFMAAGTLTDALQTPDAELILGEHEGRASPFAVVRKPGMPIRC
jgi:hypothetical protein